MLTQVTARFAEHRPGPPPECESLATGSEKRVHLGGELTPSCGSYVPAEWGAALGISTGSAARLLADSFDLDVRMPGIWAALRIGLCDLSLARTAASRTRLLSAATALLVEEAVLPLLPNLTRARLLALIDRIIAREEPAALEERVRQVTDRREVWIDPTCDDHAGISGTLDGIDASRLDSRLDELAGMLGLVQRAGFPGFGPQAETFQQRRARALGLLPDPACVDVLVRAARAITHPSADSSSASGNTAAEGLLRPVTLYVHLRADGTTDLEGHGVLSLPTVRDLLSTTSVTVRPVLDLTVPHSSSRYRPSETVDEAVVVRNPRCVFPYCDRESRRCQRDHTEPWPKGPTSTDNLGPLCVHHHHIKTHGQWTVVQQRPGRFVWRSPGGQQYEVDPDGTERHWAPG
ncbi:MAG: hypothetical protein AVDCRST_MAG21-1026 [uncultured Nocardioidaceae bacterium]|uniref:HNH nuclease domain-containing protein n=1 Tax=uncultured Nocardioidaceae bacterium TaxID=253824 RepID=A0A6J4N7S4_9ACTN|nr:MAG: hypothetical protein AVDCRST_MAG21-1026 [uncultured Nocardioidaceae bacterium]